MNKLLLFLLLVLIVVVMNKKFCRTVKGKRRCSNLKPQMNARDIIKEQMKELKNNNQRNSGIKSAFKYASKQNKENTGPYPNFEKMVQNETYKHLLNFKRWKFLSGTTRKINDEIYIVDVEIVSSHDDNKYIYTFFVSIFLMLIF